MMGPFVDDEQSIDCALLSVPILLGAAPKRNAVRQQWREV